MMRVLRLVLVLMLVLLWMLLVRRRRVVLVQVVGESGRRLLLLLMLLLVLTQDRLRNQGQSMVCTSAEAEIDRSVRIDSAALHVDVLTRVRV